jgi:hypothetical protein
VTMVSPLPASLLDLGAPCNCYGRLITDLGVCAMCRAVQGEETQGIWNQLILDLSQKVSCANFETFSEEIWAELTRMTGFDDFASDADRKNAVTEIVAYTWSTFRDEDDDFGMRGAATDGAPLELPATPRGRPSSKGKGKLKPPALSIHKEITKDRRSRSAAPRGSETPAMPPVLPPLPTPARARGRDPTSSTSEAAKARKKTEAAEASAEEDADTTDEDEAGEPDIKDIFKLLKLSAKGQRKNDKGVKKTLDNLLGIATSTKSDILGLRSELAAQREALTRLEDEQGVMKKVDDKLQEEINKGTLKVGQLETRLAKLEAGGPSTGMPEAWTPLKMVFSRFCEFDQKDSCGADYLEVMFSLKGFQAILEEDEATKGRGLATAMGTAVPEMRFPGSSTSFTVAVSKEHSPLLGELCAAFARHCTDKRLLMKGAVVRMCAVDKPPQTREMQRTAGLVQRGLQAACDNAAAKAADGGSRWYPDVFFLGSCNCFIAQLGPGENTDLDKYGKVRATLNKRLVGQVTVTGVLWRDAVLEPLLGVKGQEVEMLGHENMSR